MPEKQNTGSFEEKGKSIGRSIDQSINTVKKGIDTTKQAVNQAEKDVNARSEKKANEVKKGVTDIADKGKKTIDSGFSFINNTYKNISQGVKEKVNQVQKGTGEFIAASKEWAGNRIADLDSANKTIDRAIKEGTLKAIEYSVTTGVLIIKVGNEVINVSVRKSKENIAMLNNYIDKKVVKSVAFAKEKGMLVINTLEGAKKVAIAEAINAKLVIIKGGKIVVDKTKLYVENTGKNIKQNIDQKVATINKTIDKGVENADKIIASGKKSLANGLRNTADNIDPDAKLLTINN